MNGAPLTHELFQRQTELFPSSVAVVAGDRVMSYAQLNFAANQVAHLLAEYGVGPGELVGVCLPRDFDLVVSLMAVWKAGAAYVPLDPGHPVARTAAVLADAAPGVVIADESTVDLVRAAGGTPVLVGDAHGKRGRSPKIAVSGQDPAYVLHTSGSTGRPKGVVISHAGIGNRIAWAVRAHGMGPRDRVLQKTTLSFDAACWEIFAPLTSRGAVVLAPPGAERDAAAMVTAVGDYGVTILQVVPSMLRLLVEEPGWDRCTALRLLCSAGEPLHAELAQRFLDAVGRDVEVVNTYGPTECSIDVTAHTFDPVRLTGPVPIGGPIDGMRVLVVDPDDQPGDEGELCVGGVGVAHGYLGRPALTAARFVPDPTGPPGARLYRTGDRVRRRTDGELDYLGRTDDQVKINGVRIEPAEIEGALASHASVLEAAVQPYLLQGGEKRLAAYVRLRADAPRGTYTWLAAFLAEQLPGTHVPSAFVELRSFPTTASGKLDRAALPPPGAPRSSALGTAAERRVARVWRELLGLEDVGAHDDFFRLGGTSLQFTRLANRLRAATGKDIPVSTLRTATTVAAQALLVIDTDTDTAEDAVPAEVRPVPRTGGLPLSFGQRRIWLLDRLNPGSREWVAGHFLPVPAGVGLPLVQRALDLLVARHEVLRTTFTVVDGEPRQVIGPPAPMPLRVADASSSITALVDEEADRGFDLTTGPVVRALSDGRTLVVLMHHIACDGWSTAVLEQDFGEIMAALLAGRPPELPPLPVQYADYAVWQRDRLTSDVLDRELTYWRGALSGAEPLALRTDRPRPPARDGRGAVVTFTVAPSVGAALAELGRRVDATPFMTFLTAYAVLLARYSGQWDVVVGTPVAGRERPEIEGVVGFFLNNLVLRCRLDRALTFEQALESVRNMCKEAFAHQELPFEQLVADLAPERDLSRTPLYQVAFDMHDEKLTGTLTDPADIGVLAEVSRTTKTDLTLYLRSTSDGGLHGVLEYATSLFDRSTMDRMAGHLLRLLGAVAANPRTRLDTVDLLAEEERRELAGWQHTPAPDSAMGSVLAAFERQAAARPHAVALVVRGEHISFRELDERANRLARHLRTLGVEQESVVGVLLRRGVALMTTLLAVWKAGGAYLPLDPDFPAGRHGYALADAGVRVLVTQQAYYPPMTGEFGGHMVLVDAHADRIAIDSELATPMSRVDDPDGLAYVIYTSGSTGRPKGVQIPHRGLANHVQWAVDELVTRGDGGAPVFSSVAFDLVVPNVWAPLAAGRPTHLLPQDTDLTELGTRLSAAAPFSFVKLTPGHLEVLSHQIPAERMACLAETVVVAGERLPVELAARWAGALGDGRLINEYGPTETSVGACVHPVHTPVGGLSIPIGRPLPGVSVYVLDELLRPMPVGLTGELYVGGAGVARGYVRRPELTAERFVPDPTGPPGARMYRTGDLARLLPGGEVDFIGRIDDQVKIRGHRVEPGEVTGVLRAHPAVRDAVVVAGTGVAGAVLTAYCVTDVSTDELAAHCAKLLPDHMVPDRFGLVEEIPLTANGKLDRAALPHVEDGGGESAAPEGVVQERSRSSSPSCSARRSARTTTSSTVEGTRSWRSDWSRRCSPPSTWTCPSGPCSKDPPSPRWRRWSRPRFGRRSTGCRTRNCCGKAERRDDRGRLHIRAPEVRW
nr:AMP-dependent synthetase and ligase [uncultured bacterium]